ncbi:MAG: DUF423 domain-containing protein [Nannocystaceae bacterium]
MSRSTALIIAALLGMLGVMAGAFGAHALAARVEPEALAWWRTATSYQLVHAVVLLTLALTGAVEHPWGRRAFQCTVLGILVFSGTLGAMTLGAPRWMGMITPVGGLCLILGWGCLVLEGRARARGDLAEPSGDPRSD